MSRFMRAAGVMSSQLAMSVGEVSGGGSPTPGPDVRPLLCTWLPAAANWDWDVVPCACNVGVSAIGEPFSAAMRRGSIVGTAPAKGDVGAPAAPGNAPGAPVGDPGVGG